MDYCHATLCITNSLKAVRALLTNLEHGDVEATGDAVPVTVSDVVQHALELFVGVCTKARGKRQEAIGKRR